MKNSTPIQTKLVLWTIAIIGGVWAFFIHTTNIRSLEEQNSVKVETGMVITRDDASYIRPAENFAQKGIWKDNTEGVSSYIQRPPGMGMLHYIFYSISPQHNGFLHKLFNCGLHVLSIYCFGLIGLLLLNKKWAIGVQLLYALLPCFWGYLFYYLTEPVTVPLMVFLFFAYLQYHRAPSSKWLLLQAIVCGLILLVRPQLMFFILPFFYFLVKFLRTKTPHKIPVFLMAFLFGFGGFISWEIRSASIVHRFTWSHGIYDITNNTQYRPIHQSFVELFKVWDYDNNRFHTMMLDAWEPTWEPSAEWADKNIHLHGCKGITKNEILLLLVEYSAIAKQQRPIFDSNGIIPTEQENERILRLKVDSITRVLKTKNFVLRNIIGPFRSAEFMLVKSQLNLHIFQHTYRGFWWMETLRYSSLVLILLSFLLSFLQVRDFKDKPVFLFLLATILYFGYLCFFHKINEERYILPLLPIMLLIAANTLYKVLKKTRE